MCHKCNLYDSQVETFWIYNNITYCLSIHSNNSRFSKDFGVLGDFIFFLGQIVFVSSQNIRILFMIS